MNLLLTRYLPKKISATFYAYPFLSMCNSLHSSNSFLTYELPFSPLYASPIAIKLSYSSSGISPNRRYLLHRWLSLYLPRARSILSDGEFFFRFVISHCQKPLLPKQAAKIPTNATSVVSFTILSYLYFLISSIFVIVFALHCLLAVILF